MGDDDIIKFFIIEKIKTEESIDYDRYFTDKIRYEEIAKISDPFSLSRKEFTELQKKISYLLGKQSYYGGRVIELIVFNDAELTPNSLTKEWDKLKKKEIQTQKAKEAKAAKAAATRKKNSLAKKQRELDRLKRELGEI